MNSAFRAQIVEMLASYRWRARDNLILFECIRELFAHNPREILEHLPAALTRRGFPDISCDSLCAPSALDSDAALVLAEKLLRASQ